MSLYGDLPPLPGQATPPATPGAAPAVAPSSGGATPPAATTAAAARFALMQPRALVKPAGTGAPAKSAAQTAALLAQVQARIAEQKAQQHNALLQKQQQQSTTAASSATLSATPPTAAAPFYLPSHANTASPLLAAQSTTAAAEEDDPSLFGLTAAQRANEYDPRMPNEYEHYVKLRDQRRREEKNAAQQRRERERRDRRRSDDEDDERGEPMPPLPVLVIHPTPPAPAAAGRAGAGGASPAWPSPATAPAATSGSPAVKLDLSVSSGEEAFARRAAMSRGVAPVQPPPQPQQSFYDSNKRARTDSGGGGAPGGSPCPPSRVVLLLNMVARGEVDEELEAETADECGKYGRVIKCTVFEVPLGAGAAPVPEDEAVRIFVKFDQISAAVAAQQELNGRPFAGRKVKAMFVDESKFNRGQLAP